MDYCCLEEWVYKENIDHWMDTCSFCFGYQWVSIFNSIVANFRDRDSNLYVSWVSKISYSYLNYRQFIIKILQPIYYSSHLWELFSQCGYQHIPYQTQTETSNCAKESFRTFRLSYCIEKTNLLFLFHLVEYGDLSCSEWNSGLNFLRSGRIFHFRV